MSKPINVWAKIYAHGIPSIEWTWAADEAVASGAPPHRATSAHLLIGDVDLAISLTEAELLAQILTEAVAQRRAELNVARAKEAARG
jgi:hypothetical protein